MMWLWLAFACAIRPEVHFQRARASAREGEEVMFGFKGTIHELLPKEVSPSPILYFEGYNISHRVGRRLLGREILLYEDAEGKVLDCFRGRRVQHVANDPVNFDLTDARPATPGRWSFTFPIQYPSPVADLTGESTYISLELFDFLSPPRSWRRSVPAHLVWSRVGQPLPWMNAGSEPTWLVYHATGKKTRWEELSTAVQEWVMAQEPEFRHAPTEDRRPNETSWTAFREQGTSECP